MTQPPAPDWSTRLAWSVAHEVRRHRQGQGLSAQQLADRCAELGMPIQRSVLANLESGRRTTVTVAEILVLAAALDIPPALLLFPVGHAESVEVLPGKQQESLEAVEWFSGARRPLARGRAPHNVLYLYRMHRHFSLTIRRLLNLREEVRAEFAAAGANPDEVFQQLTEARAALQEQQTRVIHYREQWGDVALDDPEAAPLEAQEAERKASEMLADVRHLETRRANLSYLEHRLKDLDRSIQDAAMDLEKVRIDIKDGGWILPRLRDDLYGVVASTPMDKSPDLEPDPTLKEPEE
jgi:transcriptional regulator with XRE-family HTH domain